MIHLLAEYAAVAAVFCALAGLGTVPVRFLERTARPDRLLRLPLLTIAGWGLAALASAIGAVAGIEQTWLARALLGLGLLLLPLFGEGGRGARWRLLGDLALLLVFVAPMGLLVAGTPATAFDEFAQWLPNTRYLVEHGHYWGWPEWQGVSSKPGYPNGSAVIALLADQLTGPAVEAPFKTFVVILLGAFGAALAALAGSRWPSDPARPAVARLAATGLLAGGCLIAFLDPFVDPRIAFTAYTDTPSAVIIALAVLVTAYGIGAARRDAADVAAGWFAWAGLLSLTLVLLRTTNLVLVVALDGGGGLLLLSLRAGSPRLWLRWALLLTAPAAMGVPVWQLLLSLARIGPDIAPRPLAAWDWLAPLTVARALFLDRLTGNPLLGGAALGLAAVALVGGAAVWRHLDIAGDDALPPARIVVVLTAIVGACFVGFLAWTYIAVFSAEEVAAAASLWRYLSELGPMDLWLTGCCVILESPAGSAGMSGRPSGFCRSRSRRRFPGAAPGCRARLLPARLPFPRCRGGAGGDCRAAPCAGAVRNARPQSGASGGGQSDDGRLDGLRAGLDMRWPASKLGSVRVSCQERAARRHRSVGLGRRPRRGAGFHAARSLCPADATGRPGRVAARASRGKGRALAGAGVNQASAGAALFELGALAAPAAVEDEPARRGEVPGEPGERPRLQRRGPGANGKAGQGQSAPHRPHNWQARRSDWRPGSVATRATACHRHQT